MGEAIADLSGSGNQQVKTRVWRVGQEQNNNRTLFQADIQYLSNGWGSWTGSEGYWSISAPGLWADGRWTIPYANRNDSPILWSGQWWIGHDSEGWISDFHVNGHINYNAHGSIGSGTASAYEPAAPRIPKPPTVPRNLRTANFDPRGFGVYYDAPADDRGAGVDQYSAKWFEINGSNNPLVWHDFGSRGYTSPMGGAGPALKPSTEYHVYISAHNSAGWGPEASIGGRTLSGAYVGSGGGYPGTEIKVGKDGSFVTVPEVRIGKNDQFVLAG